MPHFLRWYEDSDDSIFHAMPHLGLVASSVEENTIACAVRHNVVVHVTFLCSHTDADAVPASLFTDSTAEDLSMLLTYD